MNLFPPALSDFFDTDGFFTPGWFTRDIESTMPAVNIRENGKEFTVEVAVPGYKKEDFKLEIDANVLTIRAEKSEENVQNDERFTRKEFAYNAFTRSFTVALLGRWLKERQRWWDWRHAPLRSRL